MKRKLFLIGLAGLMPVAIVGNASAAWDRPQFKMNYDSIGVMEISGVGAGGAAATILDTTDTWLNSANGHTAGETMTATYYEDGGGVYTSMYLYAHMYDSNATTDSNRWYVVVEQSIGGDGGTDRTEDIFWDPVDSILFNGAVPVGKKVTLNGMPLIRFRNQYAAKTCQLDTMTCFVKAQFIR